MKCPRCKGTGTVKVPSFTDPKRQVDRMCGVCFGRKTLKPNVSDLIELLIKVRDHLSDGHNCAICQDLYSEIIDRTNEMNA